LVFSKYSDKRLVVVEDCNLKQWGDTQLESLQQLVLDATTTVSLATNVDKRLKNLQAFAQVRSVFQASMNSALAHRSGRRGDRHSSRARNYDYPKMSLNIWQK